MFIYFFVYVLNCERNGGKIQTTFLGRWFPFPCSLLRIICLYLGPLILFYDFTGSCSTGALWILFYSLTDFVLLKNTIMDIVLLKKLRNTFIFLLRLILFYCPSQKSVSAGFCSTQYWILFYCKKQSTEKMVNCIGLVILVKSWTCYQKLRHNIII